MKKFIWLFGENLGNTYNNNSYYFWDEVCNVKDEINKYFILSRNKQNLDFYKTLPQDKQDKIIWKNSLKHMELFKKAEPHHFRHTVISFQIYVHNAKSVLFFPL